MTDLAVVGLDPRFRGGGLEMMEAFWHAACVLGREPQLYYVAHPSLAGVSISGSPLDVPGTRVRPRRVDALRQLAGARRIAPAVARARSRWVVATAAPFGLAAALGGRPYACWIGTALDEEWAARRAGLPWSRRAALAINAPPLRRIERTVLARAALLFTISPAAREGLARAVRASVDQIGVLPVPVDSDRFHPLPDDDWRARLEEPVLVFVGRADDPRKNVRLLLEALPEIRRRVPTARVRLVGSPPPGPLPEGVEVAGVVPSVGEYVRDAALLVLPSLQEGFGIVAAEALASGVPVLSTPCGGPEELLRASGGGTVLDGFSPEELAAAAAELLGDAGTLSEMRRRGREHVAREHSPERLRDLLAQAFRELDAC